MELPGESVGHHAMDGTLGRVLGGVEEAETIYHAQQIQHSTLGVGVDGVAERLALTFAAHPERTGNPGI